MSLMERTEEVLYFESLDRSAKGFIAVAAHRLKYRLPAPIHCNVPLLCSGKRLYGAGCSAKADTGQKRGIARRLPRQTELVRAGGHIFGSGALPLNCDDLSTVCGTWNGSVSPYYGSLTTASTTASPPSLAPRPAETAITTPAHRIHLSRECSPRPVEPEQLYPPPEALSYSRRNHP